MPFKYYRKIVLQDERIKLEPMTYEHFELFVPITIANPNLLNFSPSRLGTKVYLKEYFKSALAARFDHNRYPFMIYDKQSNQYVGSTSFGKYCPNNKQIDIGWTWVAKEFQRTGINRHCKYLLLQYAFEIIKCERVELKTDERNLQSQKAIRAIGGRYEGEIKKITAMPDGHQRKTIYYSILRSEWPGLMEEVFSKHIKEITP